MELDGFRKSNKHIFLAAGVGNVAVIAWLREHCCFWNEYACRHAARQGHLEALVWLRERSCPWDHASTCSADEGGGRPNLIQQADSRSIASLIHSRVAFEQEATGSHTARQPTSPQRGQCQTQCRRWPARESMAAGRAHDVNFELRADAQHGRGLWAVEPIPEGTIILLAHAYSTGVGDLSCANCLADLAQPTGGASDGDGDGARCADCTLRYCGVQCRSADAHSKVVCLVLKRLSASADWDTPLVRHLVRLVSALEIAAAARGTAPCASSIALQHEPEDLLAITTRLRAEPGHLEIGPHDVARLDACRARMPTARYNQVTATTKFVQRLWRRATGAEPMVDVAGALCRIMHNGFGVRNSSGVEVGCALLPTASMFNHSCKPSCKFRAALGGRRAGRSLEFIATRAIAAGEQITISYVDVTLPREARRARLKESYYFDCACACCARMR